MICCKIITNFSNVKGQFSKLLNELSFKGDVLWEDNCLFFADVKDDMNERKTRNILKKCGYDNCYIDSYDKDNVPHESDNINAWIYDRSAKICYNACEKESQEAFRQISKGLDILNAEIDEIESSVSDRRKSKK